ncbi:hypothetical protein AB0E85_26865 [Streptomyces sp. NPDC029044]
MRNRIRPLQARDVSRTGSEAIDQAQRTVREEQRPGRFHRVSCAGV